MKKSISFFIMIAVIMFISSCAIGAVVPEQTQGPAASVFPPAPAATSTPAAKPTPTAAPSPTPIPLTSITLGEGGFYFSVDGKESFIFSHNVAGYQFDHYRTFIDWAKTGGSSFVRIQLDSWGMGYTSVGGVDEAWAGRWDAVFDIARENGIYVLPVFSGWFDWNAGKGYSTWKDNPMNEANGGPVNSPKELFEKDSNTQKIWLDWMKALVARWKGRDNIIGWEIFSEVNLASGPTERSGIDFVNAAAAVIRSADPSRPVTASIADTGTWPHFYRDADIDFIQVHPYPPSAELDRTVIWEVRNYLDKYKLPVLIGESGLNAESPEKYSGNAQIGVRHAIWAGIVSGAMNGRALYWEDSFALFYPKLGMAWMNKYKTLELPSSEFVKGVDFNGFAPLSSKTTKGVWGAAVGNESSFIGWFRDAGCVPPNYKLKAVISGQSVTITVPGGAANWKVDFYSTANGTTLLGSVSVARSGKTITIPLPDFTDDIAFKAYAE